MFPRECSDLARARVIPTATRAASAHLIWCNVNADYDVTARVYAIVNVLTTRVNRLPIRAAYAEDAALTLPISPPLLKS